MRPFYIDLSSKNTQKNTKNCSSDFKISLLQSLYVPPPCSHDHPRHMDVLYGYPIDPTRTPVAYMRPFYIDLSSKNTKHCSSDFNISLLQYLKPYLHLAPMTTQDPWMSYGYPIDPRRTPAVYMRPFQIDLSFKNTQKYYKLQL